jgi:CheY-like chemotaxis protein
MAIARAYLLVRQWGGDIETSNGEFRIALPAPPSEPVTEVPEGVSASRGRTILLVDDEAGIRGPLVKFLRQRGYFVLEASSAEAALAVARGQQIDLLLTDVQMPGMTGGELARTLYAADPRLKVLYMSGYTPDEGVRSGALPPGSGFLSKPFTLAALLDRVRGLFEP